MKAKTLFILTIASLPLFACGGGKDCDASLSYPRCNDEGVVENCYEGKIYRDRDCAEGTFCLDGSFGDGTAWAACVQDGAVACDFDAHVPECEDGENIWVCTSGGYTILVNCPGEGEGFVCKESPVRAACTDPAALPCDPASYAETCEGDTPTYCDTEFGFVSGRTPCEAPEVCKVGDQGPVCVGADSEPCDYLDYLPTCVEDARLDCDALTAFTELEPCDAGEQCLESAAWPGAKCFPSEAVLCERESFVPRCDTTSQQMFCNAFGVEEALDCEAEEFCLTSSLGGFCVENTAQLCDPETFTPSCDGDTPLICNPATGFTHHQLPCADPLVCKVGTFGPRCVDADSQPCEQHEFFCDGAYMVICFNGLTERLACDEGLICVTDAYAWIFGMSCVDPEAPACDVTDPVLCDEQTGERCAGGYESAFDCGEGNACATDGQLYFCVPDTTPTCDPATYDYRCEGDEVHTCLVPGYELSWTCAEGYACAADEESAACLATP